jgi:hypothetical protein
MTVPCAFSKPFERVSRQPGSMSQVLADGSHADLQNVKEDSSKAGNETEVSSSSEFLGRFLERMLKSGRMSNLLVLRLAPCRERVGVNRESRTGGWLQI